MVLRPKGTSHNKCNAVRLGSQTLPHMTLNNAVRRCSAFSLQKSEISGTCPAARPRACVCMCVCVCVVCGVLVVESDSSGSGLGSSPEGPSLAGPSSTGVLQNFQSADFMGTLWRGLTLLGKRTLKIRKIFCHAIVG